MENVSDESQLVVLLIGPMDIHLKMKHLWQTRNNM